MRLLHVRDHKFRDFYPPAVERYAVASHRWRRDAEVSFQDVQGGLGCESFGHRKVRGFCDFVNSHVKGVDWIWIDTCCVDQKSSAEVSEAVNSMFKWYQSAVVCLAYLQDVTEEDVTQASPGQVVPSTLSRSQWHESEWFHRGWTLQELLAPRLVIFLTREWGVIGHKEGVEAAKISILDKRPSLVQEVASITKIPAEVLICYANSSQCSVEERLEWRKNRETTRPEDLAYCMLGIFGVYLSLIYGEGIEEADFRLRETIETKRKRMMERSGATVSNNAAPIISDFTGEASVRSPMPESRDGQDLDSCTVKPHSATSVLDTERTAGEKSTGPDSSILPYQIIDPPTSDEPRYRYFLDGEYLSGHIAMGYLRSLEGVSEVQNATFGDRVGYLIYGALLEEGQILELRRRSKEHERIRRVDRCLITRS